MVKKYDQFMMAATNDRANAERLREHDPKLADLLIKHVDSCTEVYNYIFSKIEKK